MTNSLKLIEEEYNRECNTVTDIHEHLPTLYKYALQCNTILETGVRGCISSWALVYGLLNNNIINTDKKILLNDIDECNISKFLDLTKNENVNVEYKWINNLKLEFQSNETYDLVFIDTWHVYGQLKRELEKFNKIANKYIIMHDTTVDEIYGETIRMNLNADQQSIDSGIPKNEILKGLWPAIEEFLQMHPEWILKERYTNNNGLTILERISY